MKIIFSIFPKFYRELSMEQLAELIREVGLDTTNLVIRDGYWCEPKNLKRDVANFVNYMAKQGCKVQFATTPYSYGTLAQDSTPLQIMADNGVREFRIGYFLHENNDTRKALREARTELEQLAELCLKHGVRAIYQVHHGMLVSNASSAYALVNGLPAKAIGIELDPGNQSFEGLEDWEQSASLLGEYLSAYGVKDSRPIFDPAKQLNPEKGWSRDWCPADEGEINWHKVIRPLMRRDWSGTFVFMPFYHEHDSAPRTVALKKEVAYLREVIRQIETQSKQ